MAGVIVESWGWEHNNVDAEFMSGLAPSASCSVINSQLGLDGMQKCLHITPHKTEAFYRPGNLHDFTPGSFAMAAFYVKLDSVVIPTLVNPINALVAVRDETTTAFWHIKVDNDLRFELYDANGDLMDDYIYDKVRTHLIVVIWEINDATGDWAWYIKRPLVHDQPLPFYQQGGTAHFGGVDAKANFAVADATQMAGWLSGQGGETPVPPPGDCNVYHGPGYLKKDVLTIRDAIGLNQGKNGDYRKRITALTITKSSASPDCDEYGTTTKDADLYNRIGVDEGEVELLVGPYHIQHNHRVDVTWDGGARAGMDVARYSEEGDLTDKTDEDTGEITLDNGAHAVTTDHIVDVFWFTAFVGFIRKGMAVTAVAADVITVDGGTGDALPDVPKPVSVQVANAITIDGGAGDVLPAQDTILTLDRRYDLDGGDVGKWADDAGDGNTATECFYTLAGGNPGVPHGGAVAVPGPASRQTDHIDAISWIYCYRTSGGSAFWGIRGVQDGSSYNLEGGDTRDALPTSFAIRYERWTWDIADKLGPTYRMYGKQIVVGMRMLGTAKAARAVYLAEAYIGTLEAWPHVTGKPTIGKTGNVIRGKRPWH